MNKSDSIAALAKALSSLQGEIQNVHKDKSGYGYKYTELSSILDVIRPLCAKYELAVTQLCDSSTAPGGAPRVGVETVLMHSSGEWLSSSFFLDVVVNKGMSAAQAAGSVITYARRYALAAILGIAQTDNDASIKHAEEEVALIDPASLLTLQALIKNHGIDGYEIDKWLTKAKVNKLEELTLEQGLAIINMLSKRGLLG